MPFVPRRRAHPLHGHRVGMFEVRKFRGSDIGESGFRPLKKHGAGLPREPDACSNASPIVSRQAAADEGGSGGRGRSHVDSLPRKG